MGAISETNHVQLNEICGTEQFAATLSLRGYDIFRYFFDHKSTNVNIEWRAGKRGDELEYTFGMPIANSTQYQSKDIKFSHDILTYWINFVRLGFPDNSFWPKYAPPAWTFANFTTNTVCSKGDKSLNNYCKSKRNIISPLLTKFLRG